jgi:hypothetical protein
MKTITHPLFIVLAIIYAVYYGLKQTDLVFPVFITNYLADLLSIFLVNTFALWSIRKIKNKPNLELPIPLVLLSVIMFSIFFEYILPQKSPIYVYDPWDVLCYAISGAGYVLWRRI